LGTIAEVSNVVQVPKAVYKQQFVVRRYAAKNDHAVNYIWFEDLVLSSLMH
jgi:hypothetical protein